ncbi:phosphoesterase PA-phosphatase [Longispora sp. K20-0274]|uniref:phosphoesterase PA-phosphatase n=1 Tax=Longispora sp. K20-0274 TaxID=3088255 RepID=UPI00399A252E
MAGTRGARIVTEVFAPAVLAAAMPIVVGLHAGPTWWRGLGWGLLTVFFSAVVPYAVIRVFMRLGRIEGDHHIGDRRQRRLPLLFAMLSVLLGVVALWLLGAPREVVAIGAVMLAVLAGTGLVNAVWWKLSAHTAVAAGSAAVLVLLFGPVLLVTAPVVGAIAWSRVRLRDHTTAQVLAGIVLGAVLAPAVWLPLA